jgi:hypothetical protein
MSAPAGYGLVWSDEFNTMSISSSKTDTSKTWWSQLPMGGSFGSAPFRAPDSATKPFAIEQKGGATALKITMDRNAAGQLESGIITSVYPDGSSKDKLDGNPYGYYEVRMWLPEPEKGIWPAFWAIEKERLSATRDHVWEIDVVEHYGAGMPDRYTTNIHDWNWKGTTLEGHTHTYDRNVVGNNVLATGWHTYGVEITPTEMKFNFDGNVYHTMATPSTLNTDPIWMINLAAGGGWPIDPALDNVEMWVDYFRHYEKGTGTTLPDQPAPTQPSSPPASGVDTITVRISGSSYKGDPNFAFLVDGKTIDTSNLVTASHKDDKWEEFTFTGDFDQNIGVQNHRVGIKFTNDLYGGSRGDRNLYVDKVTFNGVVNDLDAKMTSNGIKYWDFAL